MKTQAQEHELIRELIKEKSISLMNHEGKDYCLACVPIVNYKRLIIDGRIFYLMPNNVFNVIIKQNLIIAQENYPENFGNGNARDVIRALYEVEPWMDFESFIETLSREQFCYIVELIDGKINNKVLRIDLYRKIKENSNGGYDFVGGIFHCFKHFSYNGRPLSTGTDINNLSHPRDLLFKILKAFFFTPFKIEDKSKFISETEINDKYNLKFSFYYEDTTGVYFINTSHKKKNNR